MTRVGGPAPVVGVAIVEGGAVEMVVAGSPFRVSGPVVVSEPDNQLMVRTPARAVAATAVKTARARREGFIGESVWRPG